MVTILRPITWAVYECLWLIIAPGYMSFKVLIKSRDVPFLSGEVYEGKLTQLSWSWCLLQGNSHFELSSVYINKSHDVHYAVDRHSSNHEFWATVSTFEPYRYPTVTTHLHPRKASRPGCVLPSKPSPNPTIQHFGCISNQYWKEVLLVLVSLITNKCYNVSAKQLSLTCVDQTCEYYQAPNVARGCDEVLHNTTGLEPHKACYKLFQQTLIRIANTGRGDVKLLTFSKQQAMMLETIPHPLNGT